MPTRIASDKNWKPKHKEHNTTTSKSKWREKKEAAAGLLALPTRIPRIPQKPNKPIGSRDELAEFRRPLATAPGRPTTPSLVFDSLKYW